MGILKTNTLNDVAIIDLLSDLFGDGGSGSVYNLLLETGDDYLLEDGGFILLE